MEWTDGMDLPNGMESKSIVRISFSRALPDHLREQAPHEYGFMPT